MESIQPFSISLSVFEHVTSGIYVIMSAQDEIYVKLVHHFFESCIHIVLNIGVCRMLCYSLGGFMMGDNQPLILTCIFRSRRIQRSSEIFHDCLCLGVVLGSAGHIRIVCVFLIVSSRICSGI